MTSDVRLIGVPTDYGTSRRGVDMGPSALRYAGVVEAVDRAGAVATDAGNLQVPRAESRDPDRSPQAGRAKFLREIREVSERLAGRVADGCADGALPLVLGGDHSVAIGTMAGAARDADLGVLWLDAHGDFNTPETTPSGNVHGMPLAAALGRGAFAEMDWARASGLDPERVALVGLRDLDDEEREAIRDSPVSAFTMSEIDARGIVPVVEEALDVATGEAADGGPTIGGAADDHASADNPSRDLHVSLDMDFLDPKEAPGVGTPARGGATYREAHAALERVADRGDRLRSLEVVEVNPILDQHNETAELACELVASALGESIL